LEALDGDAVALAVMTRYELDEAVTVLGVVLDALLQTLTGKLNRSQAEVRTAVGALRGSARKAISKAQIGKPLMNCFDLAVGAGATRLEMDAVRKTAIAVPVFGLPAIAIAITSVYFSLIEQARIVAGITFKSRDDVDTMMMTMNTVFEPAEEFAADLTDDPSVYQAILGLHASLTQFLVAEERPLPRMVAYAFPRNMPSLVLAQRIYHDASRADELRDENHVVHPLFCMRSGRALSA
jgi:prophage DNA circulation protein